MSQNNLDQLEPAIVIEPRKTVHGAVVWLHGLGADGHDFKPVVEQFGEELRDHVRFVFPHAPEIPVTINGGARMRAWYDIVDADFDRRADEAGIRKSGTILHALLDAERDAGVPSERVVAAGFSQGGAIALYTGLRYESPLAGIMALSTYLTLEDELDVPARHANQNTPIFLGHGSQDPMVPLAQCERSRLKLRQLGYKVETHTYPMPHSVCAEQLRDLDDWLNRVLLD